MHDSLHRHLSRLPRTPRRALLLFATGAFFLSLSSPPALAGRRATASRTKARAHALPTRLEIRTQPAIVRAGEPVQWTLRVVRVADGKPETRFAVAHEKLMHLIIVSRDLAWFNHLHPEYQGKGVFTLTATLPTAGTYRIFADYTQTGAGQVVLHRDVATGGDQPSPTMILPVLDVADAQGWMHQRVRAIPEGQPEVTTGPEYRVSLMSMPAHLRAGEAAMLHFRVEDAKGQPLRNLEPYLGALGHAVILSTDAETYLHAHPMEGGAHKGEKHDAMGEKHDAAPASGGPDITFHTQFPRSGIYKAWGQFQHQGQIVIASFIVNVDKAAAPPPATRRKLGTKGATGDPKVTAPVYTCPMHADVTSADPAANCPQCGMHLVRRGK